MAKRNQTPSLPTWYPLSTYERELTDGEWASAILGRFGFQAVFHNIVEDRLKDMTLRDLASRFESYLTNVRKSMDDLPPQEPSAVFPVANMNRFEVAYLAQLAAQHSTADERSWAERLAAEPKKWLAEFYERRSELMAHGEEYSIFTDENVVDSADVLGFRLPLLVNVNLDDETLKACFSIWLAGIRASLYPAPRAFEDRDLKNWKKFGLLPAFDLQLWNLLTEAGYTDAFIAQAIWPDSSLIEEKYVDRSERYRKVTKPLVASVFSSMQVSRFATQFELHRSMLEAAKEHKSGMKKKKSLSGT